MTADQIAGTLLIGGSAVFLVGAAVGVPRVFTERDPTVRLRMLEERLGTWRAAQPFYVLGPVITSLGSLVWVAKEWIKAEAALVVAGPLPSPNAQ